LLGRYELGYFPIAVEDKRAYSVLRILSESASSSCDCAVHRAVRGACGTFLADVALACGGRTWSITIDRVVLMA
jgi:hypothetical protein